MTTSTRGTALTVAAQSEIAHSRDGAAATIPPITASGARPSAPVIEQGSRNGSRTQTNESPPGRTRDHRRVVRPARPDRVVRDNGPAVMDPVLGAAGRRQVGARPLVARVPHHKGSCRQ